MRGPRSEGGDPAAGFTLLEILVVLAVMGLALGIFVSRGPARSPALEVRGAASEVAQALRGARARAIAADRSVSFVMDAPRHQYRIEGEPPHAFPLALSVSLTAPAGAIRFAPDGSSSGGRVALADGGHTTVVSVDWLTGRVRMAEAAPR